MKKPRLISVVLSVLGMGMIAIAIMVQNNATYSENKETIKTEQVDVKAIATASRKDRQEEKKNGATVILPSGEVVAVSADTKEEEVVPQRIEVYEGMTIEELSEKIERNLASLLSGKGYLITSQALEKGVDPYIAVAIMLHETGCGHGSCSALVRSCNNVGGQKGYPSCSGSYKGYNTLDEGIIGFMENLYNNYYARGLTTVETIGPRYAQSSAWPAKINSYVARIRAS